MLRSIYKTGSIKSQSGAISIIILLIVLVTSTTYLLSKLNSGIRFSVYNPKNSMVLQEIKDTLVSWAVNHPVNPGTLPMPDRNGDGDYDGDADCFNGVINNNLLLGKIPWREMETSCKDSAILSGLSILATDISGEQLWYAVSKNLVYESPDYPFISPGLLSRATDWITVRDSSGGIISDRVAFVLIAPGKALPGYTNCDGLSYTAQDRSAAAPNIENYLDSVTIGATTYSNADYDQDFIAYTNSDITTGTTTLEKCDTFNDQLVYVTIDELMELVEYRVINETSKILTAYHNTYGAIPWLSPYADPKAEIPSVRGEADNAATSATTLVDNQLDFVGAGVQVGDIVRNISDTSVGVVLTRGVPDNNTLTVGSLVLGANNNFQDGDQYHITPQSSFYINNRLSGAATIGSGGFVLEDSGMDFIEIGVMPGDIIENVTDGSSGVVGNLTVDTITVTSLTGGTDNDFDNGDNYRIRSNMGVATAGAGNILTDTNKNFVLMGVANGDLIRNITDGSFGRVTIVTATTLTVDKLEMGTSNDFTVNDVYIISRYNPVTNTSQGQLAFHQPGEYFKTGFDMDWNLNNVTLSTTASASIIQPAYQTWVQQGILTSAATMNISENDGSCVWMVEEHIECYGTFEVSDITLGGVVTSGSNTATFTDNTQSYINDGVKIGDIIQNFNDEATLFTRTADAGSSGTTLYDVGANFTSYETSGPYELLVRNNATGVQGVVTQIIDNDTLEAKDYPGGPAISFAGGNSYSLRRPQYMVVSNVVDSDTLTTKQLSGTIPDFDVGEYYRIIPSMKVTPNIGGGNIDQISGPTWMRDVGTNFCNVVGGEGVEVGDIVENVSDGSFGIIVEIWWTCEWIRATLYGGTINQFVVGNQYRVHHGYASRREFEISTRFNGGDINPLGKMTYATAEVRKRGACIGYGTDCVTAPSATALPYNLNIPTVTITDYEDDNDIGAETTATIPAAGTPTGYMRVSNIDYYLREGTNEIPEWFTRNKWHQYIFAAYSNGESPGAASICTPGTNCLELTVSTNIRDDVRALIMLAGNEVLKEDGITDQNWSNALIDEYFDLTENRDTDIDFTRLSESTTFNDRIRIAVSCPPPNASQLCWSN